MKHFLIIVNQQKDKELELTKKIKTYIEDKGGTCTHFVTEGKKEMEAAPAVSDVPKETECILVLGGDGTLIRAAAKLVQCRLPLIGVNLGTVGYLCELEAKGVLEAVKRLMQDAYVIEERMLLTGYGVMHGENTTEQIALNEVSIHRAGTLSILSLVVYVNGKYLHTFHGDGIIVSTPTGSTGYSLSAGGPIVDPKARMLLFSLFIAHNLNARSIVINADDEVMIELGSRRPQKDDMALVSFDGDGIATLEVGDKFVIKRAEATTKICKLSEESFLEILRKKMQAYS